MSSIYLYIYCIIKPDMTPSIMRCTATLTRWSRGAGVAWVAGSPGCAATSPAVDPPQNACAASGNG